MEGVEVVDQLMVQMEDQGEVVVAPELMEILLETVEELLRMGMMGEKVRIHQRRLLYLQVAAVQENLDTMVQ